MKIFNAFLNKSLFIFTAIILCSVFVLDFNHFRKGGNLFINILFIIIILCLFFNNKIKSYFKNSFFEKINIYHIILIAFLLRLIWIILIPTIPESDFGLMYRYGENVVLGDYHGFKNFAYFARFAHNTVTVLYFSFFYRVMENPLFLVKLFNVIFQTLAVYYMYKLVKEVFKKEKTAKMCAFLLTIFPPFIMYTVQTMSENIAMPFYIESVYLFFKIKNSKGKKIIFYLILCGFTLAIGNMFRMVGLVFLVAYGMYIFIYYGLKLFIKRFIPIAISFWALMFIVSQSLISLGITEVHVWASKEPSITSIVKGTNIESGGKWNPSDALIPDRCNNDVNAIKEESKRIIFERLKETPPIELAGFYFTKLISQWNKADFGAFNWSVLYEHKQVLPRILENYEDEFLLIVSIVYIIILIRALKSLFKLRRSRRKEMNFFYILFGGFILLFLITEMQTRYAFIAAWIPIILGNELSEKKKKIVI